MTAATGEAKPRGKIVDVDPGTPGRRYRYDYYDVSEPDSSFKELSAQGLQGGGPTWEGIVYGLLQLRQPETLKVVTFDAESDGLAVWSDDRGALERISRLVGEAKKSPSLLKAAIDSAKKDGRME